MADENEGAVATPVAPEEGAKEETTTEKEEGAGE